MSDLAPLPGARSILERVMELASQPNLNPEMFDRLVAWQEREEARQAEEQFNDAMNLAQAQIHPVARQSENKQASSFYAKLEAVDEAIRPIYLAHGFSVSYNTVAPLTPGNIRIECEVSRGRHSKKYYREAPADTLGPKGAPVKTILHGGGSTETFLKRYAVCGAFNVVFRGMDDDGQRGGTVFISADDVKHIETLISRLPAGDRDIFLQWANVNDVGEIQKSKLEQCVNALMERATKREAKP